MAHPVVDSSETSGPSRKVIGAATLALLFLLLVGISAGFGVALALLGLSAFVVGAFAFIRGRANWARIVTRRAAVAVAVAGFAAMGVGGVLSPSPQTENTAADAAAPSSSAAATTSAPRTTSSAPQPVAAPVPTTSAAPVLPPAPVMAITCPAGGSVASPVYAPQIAAAAPYTVTIDYGDGDRYTNDDQHLSAIFGHTYESAGTFLVSAALTDAAGQTTSATCAYTWTKPVQTAAGGSSSRSGSGAVTGGGTPGGAVAPAPAPAPAGVYYQNCDAVRAAGAAPIYPGDPGFQSKFDRDGDGTGCE